ncbi:MAG: hypothetical protein ACW98F_07110 [Candidatus Hodarchaeales archaeon]|jgi:hypothetical protein
MIQKNSLIKTSQKKLPLFLLAIFLLGLIFTSSLMVTASMLDDDDETTDIDDNDDDDSDDDDDGVEDDLETANEREITVEMSDDGMELTIESQLKVGENEDEFEINVEIEDGIEVELEYSTEVDDLEAELEFKINFYSLLEYEDINDDGVFNETEDIIVQESLLEAFDPISYKVVNTDTHVIAINSTDGVFTCILYAVGEFASFDGTIVTPAEVKIDIIIKNFNYLSETSNLALYTRLEKEYEYEDETDDEKDGFAEGESALGTTMNAFKGFFSWVDSATIDGVVQPVTASLHDEDDFADDEDDEWEQKIYLNYPHGIEIIHDPKLGVSGILRLPSSSEIVSKLLDLLKLSKEGYLGSVAIFTLFTISTVILYRRKRR